MIVPLSSRIQIASLCLLGGLVSGYLACYQLGLVHAVWDPFFGAGSEAVLRSPLSRALPLPDAVLGFMGYVGEAICVRLLDWRPAHALYVTIALGMGAGSLILVAYQILVVHTLCTPCLISAAVSLILLGPAFATLREDHPGPGPIARRFRHSHSTRGH